MNRILTVATLSAFAFAGAAQADVIYANDDFEGEPLGDFSATANSTSFINSSNSVGNSDIVANLSGGPTGQHVEARGNRDKHITLADPMTLVTDGVLSLELDFYIRFNNTASTNDGRVLYSAAGDFTDTVLIAYYSPTAGTPDPGNGILAANTWYQESLVINPGDVGGVFTDTAKIRFANDNGSAFGDRVILDDIVITGVVPEPGSLALLGLGGLLIARRRRG